MAKLEGKVLVAQGGGPTAVINQSMVGVVIEARKYAQVRKVYGAINGVTGIVNEEFMDLTQETTHNLEQVAGTPSSGLLSTRDKPARHSVVSTAIPPSRRITLVRIRTPRGQCRLVRRISGRTEFC